MRFDRLATPPCSQIPNPQGLVVGDREKVLVLVVKEEPPYPVVVTILLESIQKPEFPSTWTYKSMKTLTGGRIPDTDCLVARARDDEL